jgi:hypothetical protein
MSDLDLEPIHQRAEAATPGPWTAITDNGRKTGVGIVGQATKRGTGEAIAVFAGTGGNRHADATFTAQAREDVPALMAEVERLRSQLAATAGAEVGTEWAARCVYFDGGVMYIDSTDEDFARMVVESMAMHLASLNEATRRAGGVERVELVRRETREWPDGSRWTGPWTAADPGTEKEASQ